jgi:hypothetical protein
MNDTGIAIIIFAEVLRVQLQSGAATSEVATLHQRASI